MELFMVHAQLVKRTPGHAADSWPSRTRSPGRAIGHNVGIASDARVRLKPVCIL